MVCLWSTGSCRSRQYVRSTRSVHMPQLVPPGLREPERCRVRWKRESRKSQQKETSRQIGGVEGSASKLKRIGVDPSLIRSLQLFASCRNNLALALGQSNYLVDTGDSETFRSSIGPVNFDRFDRRCRPQAEMRPRIRTRCKTAARKDITPLFHLIFGDVHCRAYRIPGALWAASKSEGDPMADIFGHVS